MIRRAVPEAQDVIGYGMPGYKLKGKPLLYFAVSNDTIHCLQHRVRSSPRSKKNSRTMSSERGTIHFPLNKPVPVQLISRIAKLRGESWKNADLRSPAYRMAHTRFVSIGTGRCNPILPSRRVSELPSRLCRSHKE